MEVSFRKSSCELNIRRKGQKSEAHTAYIVPFFLDKHIVRMDPSFWLFDYRVTYVNHKNFCKSTRSSVRIISDLDKSVFDLKSLPGYKFCELCEVYVSDDNKHCYMCMKCVSRDGAKYKHCDRCMRCVKEIYAHCRLCQRCHLMSRNCSGNRDQGVSKYNQRNQDSYNSGANYEQSEYDADYKRGDGYDGEAGDNIGDMDFD